MEICATHRSISNSELVALSEEYHLLGEGQIPFLIKLLWDVRHFQEDLMDLPLHRLQPLFMKVCEIDQAIAKQIIEQCQADNYQVRMQCL